MCEHADAGDVRRESMKCKVSAIRVFSLCLCSLHQVLAYSLCSGHWTDSCNNVYPADPTTRLAGLGQVRFMTFRLMTRLVVGNKLQTNCTSKFTKELLIFFLMLRKIHKPIKRTSLKKYVRLRKDKVLSKCP